jgi:hypothetical protein
MDPFGLIKNGIRRGHGKVEMGGPVCHRTSVEKIAARARN